MPWTWPSNRKEESEVLGAGRGDGEGKEDLQRETTGLLPLLPQNRHRTVKVTGGSSRQMLAECRVGKNKWKPKVVKNAPENSNKILSCLQMVGIWVMLFMLLYTFLKPINVPRQSYFPRRIKGGALKDGEKRRKSKVGGKMLQKEIIFRTLFFLNR